MSERPIDATACGSSPDWPTPTATEYGSSQNGVLRHGGVTPSGSIEKPRPGAGKPGLQGMARLHWPTPTSTDANAAGSRAGTPRAAAEAKAHPGTSLTDAALGLWVTPTSRDWKGSSEAQGTRGTEDDTRGVNLPTQVFRQTRLLFGDGPDDPASPSESGKPLDWRTPAARDGDARGAQTGQAKAEAAKTWPTPNAEGGTGHRSGTNRDTWRPTLEGAAQGREPVLHDPNPQPRKVRGSLNYAWVCQLMGLPDGWLDLPLDASADWLHPASGGSR